MLLSIANIDGAVGAKEFERALAAIQRQVREHFHPEWGGEAVLRGSQAEMGARRVSMEEAHDAVIYVGSVAQDATRGVQRVLGHHTANRAGTPFGFVYLDVSAAAGESWTTTLSHEVLELLADPHASLVATVSRPELSNSPVEYELEICDPTQGDTYLVDGVEVSNFVFRRYFALSGGDPTRTNMLDLDLEPFQVRPEGYAQYRVDGYVYQFNGHAVRPARIAGRAALAEGRRNTRRAAARTSSSSAKHLPDESIDKPRPRRNRMSLLRSFVCHKPVSDGVFVEGPVVCNEIATSELEHYWANTTQRASAERSAQHIVNINKKLGRPGGSGTNPEDIHSTFKQLDAHIRDTNEPRDAGFGFPWKINFYENVNQDGDSFDLGVVQQTNPIVIPFPFLGTFDWDRDLTQRGGPGGSWNDQISCVECQGPDKYWVLFEDINFRGARLFGSGNVDNLVPSGWNDRTSSIIMCSVPGVIITDAIIAIVAG